MPAQHAAVEDQISSDKLDARLLRIAGVCVLAMMMAILDTTVVAVAQRTFIAEFGSTHAVVAWTMTGYTLTVATVIPLTGWAADRFGTKRLFLGSVAAFTVGSLLCAMAPTITLLIAFRVVQGLGGGMLMPLALIILTRAAGPKRLGRLMAVLGIPMLVGPIAGPVLGGWLIDSYSWPWIFRINLPVGVITLILAGIVLGKDRPAPSETFDFIGMLLLSPGLATLLYGVSSIPAHGTVADRHVWLPVMVGLALIGGFVVHACYRADHPLIDLRLFKNREVTAANAAMLLSVVALFGVALLLPSCLQQLLHQTPMQSGIHLMPERLGAMLTMPIAGMVVDRRGPGKIVPVGITLIAAGMGTFGYGVATQAGYSPILLTGLVIIGLGLGCTIMPLSAAAVRPLAAPHIARGSTLLSVNQHVASSLGAALMSVILTSQFNHSENIAALDKLTSPHGKGPHGMAPGPVTTPGQTLAPDFMSAVAHDLSQAYATVFVVAAALAALAYIPAAFLPKTPTPAVAGQGPMPLP
ncbi:MAG: DHA2 family efflux MFS transporter permease subunit [Mycobacterium sp.]|uniref:DHA2 family efflux MFS transporter permease subunit n=1 Tax=Mycobacterium sp. TaxID=1785 RepID=UPI0026201300|nr:DHA2 family efflux MFS transporter permease subunit [Mycobacterium sp.]MDI3313635.1 DHA2 family efflux MFS transporter permease subunit [Mycobacterium sp.]